MSDQVIIRELSDIVGVQTYPSLYIGNTEYCTHLINECLINARDEIMAGHCKRMDVFSYTDDYGEWFVTRDWANGIPTTSPEIQGDAIVKICSKLHSGSKFRDGKSSTFYNQVGGMFGIGLTAVNALSKYLIITTKANDKDNNHWQYIFEDGEFKQRQLIKLDNQDPQTPIYSTEVKFLPSSKYFQHLTWDESIIKELLAVTRYGLPEDVEINFQGNPVPNTYLDDYFGQYADMVNASYTDKFTKESCTIYVAVYDDFDSGKEFKGMVNLLIANNGTHQNLCFNLLKNKLSVIAEKEKKHVQNNDFLVPIKVLCNLSISEPQFDGQVKDKLDVKPDDIKHLIEPVIDTLIKKNQNFFNVVIDKAEEYRINIQSNKQARKSKASSKIVRVNGLKDCVSKDPELTSIYLVEGESAGTTFMKCRNPQYDALLALRGKLLNVIMDKATKTKILENQVINNIASSLGYKIFGEINPDKCRYGKIFIVADSDTDGKHIICLLINVFYSLFLELIKAGKVYIINTPLFMAKVNGNMIPIYTNEERDKYIDYIQSRNKGIGELSEEELYTAAINPETRKCLQLSYSEFDMKKLWENELGHLKMESYNNL